MLQSPVYICPAKKIFVYREILYFNVGFEDGYYDAIICSSCVVT